MATVGSVTFDINATTNVPEVAKASGAGMRTLREETVRTDAAMKASAGAFTTASAGVQNLGRAALVGSSAFNVLRNAAAGNFAAAFMALPGLFSASAAGLKALGAAALAFVATPIGALLTGLAAVTAAFITYVSHATEAAEATAKWAERAKELRGVVHALGDAAARLELESIVADFADTGVVTREMLISLHDIGERLKLQKGEWDALGQRINPVNRLMGEFNVVTDATIERLADARNQLEDVRSQLSPGEYERAAAAIDSQLNAALGTTATRAGDAAAALRDLEAAQREAARTFGMVPGSEQTQFAIAAPGSGEAVSQRLTPFEQDPASFEAARQERIDAEWNQIAEGNIRKIELEMEAQERLYQIEEDAYARRLALAADLVSGLGNAFGQFFSDLVTDSGSAGKKFLGNVLSMIGSLAIQFGTFGVLAGALQSALPFLGLTGGAAMVAGGALIAFGGALKGAGALVSAGAGGGASGGGRPLTSEFERGTGVGRPGEDAGRRGGDVNIYIQDSGRLSTDDDIALKVGRAAVRARELGVAT